MNLNFVNLFLLYNRKNAEKSISALKGQFPAWSRLIYSEMFLDFYPLDIFSIQTFLAAKLSPGPVTNSQIPPMNKPAQINMQHSGTAGALLDAE